jgi:putative ABC transport system ATP-binding protein
MFKPAHLTSASRLITRRIQPTTTTLVPKVASFSTRTPLFSDAATKAYRMSGNTKNAPPAHEMIHFKNLLSSKREFGDFRTVLHTGLYSQIVAMEV